MRGVEDDRKFLKERNEMESWTGKTVTASSEARRHSSWNEPGQHTFQRLILGASNASPLGLGTIAMSYPKHRSWTSTVRATQVVLGWQSSAYPAMIPPGYPCHRALLSHHNRKMTHSRAQYSPYATPAFIAIPSRSKHKMIQHCFAYY